MERPIFREASAADLPEIVSLLADDSLGRKRELAFEQDSRAYESAFASILTDANQLFAVAESERRIVACMQLTFIPGLSHQGAWRGQIESVRVARHCRGAGIGKQFFSWAIVQFRSRKCRIVQLTTDKSRKDALPFYEQLGFTASHEGMKMFLSF